MGLLQKPCRQFDFAGKFRTTKNTTILVARRTSGHDASRGPENPGRLEKATLIAEVVRAEQPA